MNYPKFDPELRNMIRESHDRFLVWGILLSARYPNGGCVSKEKPILVALESQEEADLVRAFRAHKARATQQGSVFKWRTYPEPGIMPAPERFFIVDPREAD